MHQQPVQTIHEHHALRLYIMPFYRRIGYVSLRDQRAVMNANAVLRFLSMFLMPAVKNFSTTGRSTVKYVRSLRSS
jgi:hypothetical protein